MFYMFTYEYLIGVKPEIHGFTPPKKKNMAIQVPPPRRHVAQGDPGPSVRTCRRRPGTRVKCLDFGSRKTDFWVTYATYIFILFI